MLIKWERCSNSLSHCVRRSVKRDRTVGGGEDGYRGRTCTLPATLRGGPNMRNEHAAQMYERAEARGATARVRPVSALPVMYRDGGGGGNGGGQSSSGDEWGSQHHQR